MKSKHILILFCALLTTIGLTELLLRTYKSPATFESETAQHSQLIKEADKLFNNKQNVKALTLYRQILKHHPNNLALLHKIATLRMRLKEYTLAELTFLKLAQASPDNVSYVTSLSNCQLHNNEIDKARSNAHKALKLKRNHPQAIFILAAIEAQNNNLNRTLKLLHIIKAEPELLKELNHKYFDSVRQQQGFIQFIGEIAPLLNKQEEKPNE